MAHFVNIFIFCNIHDNNDKVFDLKIQHNINLIIYNVAVL